MADDVNELVDPEESPLDEAGYAAFDERSELEMARVHVTSGRHEVVINPLDSGGQWIRFTHEGANDPDYVAVARSYKDRMSNPDLPKSERTKLSMQMLKEVADRKAARTPPEDVEPQVQRITTAPRPVKQARVKVTFAFGPLGTHVASYDDVVVSDNVVLLASAVDSGDGHYVPPAQYAMVVGIEGYSAPLPVMLVGQVRFGGHDQVILLVTAEE